MKNALILHGTDFDKKQKQHLNNWFPWLKNELGNFLKDFNFNEETIVIGHSSGGAMVFGLLHKLLPEKKINLAISVAGFYHDEGWHCEGLFSEPWDWEKIKKQTNKILVISSDNDPYIKPEQTQYLAKNADVEPIIFPNAGHLSLGAGERFRQFPELLELIKTNA